MILLYHNLFSETALSGWEIAADDYMTTADSFRRDIDALRRDRRVRFTSPHDFFQRPFEPCPCIDVYITFDDGYHSTRAALSHLAGFGIPAAVFVNSGVIGTMDLPWPEKLLCFCHFLGDAALQVRLGERSWAWSRGDDLATKIGVFIDLRDSLKIVDTDIREAFLAEIYRRYDFDIASVSSRDPFYPRLRLLSWDDLRWICAQGFDVGGHTRTHVILTQASRERIRREIFDDRTAIERQLGRRVGLFAVPNGGPEDFDARIIDCCREAGYEFILTAFGGINSRIPDAFVLNRCDVGNATGKVDMLIDRIATVATVP